MAMITVLSCLTFEVSWLVVPFFVAVALVVVAVAAFALVVLQIVVVFELTLIRF